MDDPYRNYKINKKEDKKPDGSNLSNPILIKNLVRPMDYKKNQVEKIKYAR